jgi:hypothetical protein
MIDPAALKTEGLIDVSASCKPRRPLLHESCNALFEIGRLSGFHLRAMFHFEL